MNAAASIANGLWLAMSLGAARRFARALDEPLVAQDTWLRRQLARHAQSDFGRTHEFADIRSAADFARRVPLTDYAGVEPFVQRITRGQRDVLACGRVTHLAPTSGSSGARKLIPFSAALQEGFSAAVRAWMVDLARRRPGLVGGPAYWSVSPLAEPDDEQGALRGPPEAPLRAAPAFDMLTDTPRGARARDEAPAAIPVGFADDADYLGGLMAWLVRQALAVPASLRYVRDMPAFWGLTLLCLLRHRDLRLISVWHPSFLDLLVGAAEASWPALLDGVASGECPWVDALPPNARASCRAASDPIRAAELRRIGPADWPRWWPQLQVLSCWGEQAAESGYARLRNRVPGVLVQAKGLLATEAVVTIPFGAHRPLAVTSHFFEFVDERGDIRRAHELARGERYEVVVTNGGGLWRYRLGDVVECTGHLRRTPSLRFLGRAGNVSDLRGEKLSEAFVAQTLRSLWPGEATPTYCALRARASNGTAGYELLVSAEAMTIPSTELGASLEVALGANPHYALARRLGQLEPVRVIPVATDMARMELAAQRGRLGDAKPAVLLGAPKHHA